MLNQHATFCFFMKTIQAAIISKAGRPLMRFVRVVCWRYGRDMEALRHAKCIQWFNQREGPTRRRAAQCERHLSERVHCASIALNASVCIQRNGRDILTAIPGSFWTSSHSTGCPSKEWYYWYCQLLQRPIKF